MNRTIRLLDSNHARLVGLIANLDEDLLSRRPAENEWSISEVLHHLYLVEERVVNELQNRLAKPPTSAGFLRSLIPMRIVSWRFMRVKAPKIVNPVGTFDLATSLQNWEACRNQLKQICIDNGSSRLRKTVLPHPLLGNINGRAAVSMVAFHERRHSKQIKEILKKLSS